MKKDLNQDTEVILDKNYYKKQIIKLSLLGVTGFILGFFILGGSPESDTIIMNFVAGFACAGVPFAWSLINKIFKYSPGGSIKFIIIFYVIKFMLSVFLGLIAFPIGLGYFIFKFVQTKNQEANGELIAEELEMAAE